jgi:uncharacterized protein YjiS (DUF1127 family)
MSVHTFTVGARHGGITISAALASFVERLLDRRVAHERYRTVVRELEDYSPAELSGLGISDADIGRVARRASRGW